MGKDNTLHDSDRPRTPLWEVLTGVAGLIIAGAIALFLMLSALRTDTAPPEFTFDVTGTRATGTRVTREWFLLHVRIGNTGQRTAADLQVEARLSNPDGSVESAMLVIDYLAPGSVRDVGFYFPTDPAAGELEFLPRSYQEP